MPRLLSRPHYVLLLALLSPLALGQKPDPEQLQLASVGAAVASVGSENALYQKRADWVMPIASVTKLMTALVVLESGAPLNQWLTVEKRHFPAEANAFSRIRPGSEAKRSDLVQIAMISSENYAAYLLARHHPEGYDAFITAMNAKARALGMTQTRFVDATGLSAANVSSANDLVKLVNAAYSNETLRQLSTQGSHYVRFRNPVYTLVFGNTNPLVHSSRWDVLLTKTGYLNAAGRCLVMVANVDGKATIVVLLNSFGTRTPLGDSGRIRRWLENGQGGTVASAALRYEQEVVELLQQQKAAASMSATDLAIPTTLPKPPESGCQQQHCERAK